MINDMGSGGYVGATGSVININFDGDVVVDSKQRMNQLTDEISRKIGRNMRLSR